MTSEQPAQTMHIRLELPRARLRRWHGWLVAHLKTCAGHENQNHISIVFTEGEPATPTALSLLLTLEALTRSGAAQSGTATITAEDLLTEIATPAHTDCDVIVRIGGAAETGEQSRHKDAPQVTLLFDGHRHEDALWLALLDRRSPTISLDVGRSAEHVAREATRTAVPGLEAPHMLSHSADAVVSRAIEVIGTCISDLAGDTKNLAAHHLMATPAPNPTHPAHAQRKGVQAHTRPKGHPIGAIERGEIGVRSNMPRTRGLKRGTAQFLVRRVGDKARAMLRQVTKTAPNWSVAWRPRHAFAPGAATTLNVQDFHGLRDDGARYYADPFGLDKDGLTHVFVEEFPHATARGLISAFTIDANGHCSEPRPVLETPHHLSYPQVFEHAGEVFMLPEASASGGVDLYRADTFPDVWTHDTRLIDEPLHDATLHFDGTRWWLFAATQFLKSSSWCALKIFTADKLRGPWKPISTAPIKIDARSARPAGALIAQDGALWRPAQNCATGYGHGLTWCRLVRLTPDTVVEHAVGSMQFASANACLGPHTWNATPSIEMIDIFAAPSTRPPAPPAPPRP